jgi:hypothetical protein
MIYSFAVYNFGSVDTIIIIIIIIIVIINLFLPIFQSTIKFNYLHFYNLYVGLEIF